MRLSGVICFIVLASACLMRAADSRPISLERMQAIYDEVTTPSKYGVVIEPPPGKKVDCPNVFRHGRKWFMIYIQLENDPQGYSTKFAESDDLLHWKSRGTILPRGRTNTWDQANAAGGVAFFDPRWGGSNKLQKHDGRYWLSYLGGAKPGYETPPLSIGIRPVTRSHSLDELSGLPSSKSPQSHGLSQNSADRNQRPAACQGNARRGFAHFGE